jgi:hypothetical protein
VLEALLLFFVFLAHDAADELRRRLLEELARVQPIVIVSVQCLSTARISLSCLHSSPKSKQMQTHPRVPVDPHILHAAGDEARPAAELVLVAHLERDVDDEHRASLRSGRVRRGGEELVALVLVVHKLAADEEERPDWCGSVTKERIR